MALARIAKPTWCFLRRRVAGAGGVGAPGLRRGRFAPSARFARLRAPGDPSDPGEAERATDVDEDAAGGGDPDSDPQIDPELIAELLLELRQDRGGVLSELVREVRRHVVEVLGAAEAGVGADRDGERECEHQRA